MAQKAHTGATFRCLPFPKTLVEHHEMKFTHLFIQQVRKVLLDPEAPACLLTVLCQYGKPRLCMHVAARRVTLQRQLVELQRHWLQHEGSLSSLNR